MSATATTAHLELRYLYVSAATRQEGRLKYLRFHYDKDSTMTHAKQMDCEQHSDQYGSFCNVSLSGLEAVGTYYYCYEVANEVDVMKTEVKRFTTEDYGLPSVSIVNVTDLTGVGFTCHGNVSDGGETQVLERGFCYSAHNSSPTVEDAHLSAGEGLGTFSAEVNGLSSGSGYYVRAYARNMKGIAYSAMRVVNTTSGVPVVTTGNVSSITTSTALCAANVTSDGGFALTAKGVCWSTSQNPTVSGSHTNNGTATGAYSGYMTGLTPDTTYFVRAYATNSKGTSYGAQKSFTTESLCPSTVTDYDGNIYNTVQIGSQCWMKQNLRTTHYANGASIALGSSTSTTTPYRYYPNNNSSNVSTYGYLYNWPAVMHGAGSSSSNPSGVQGICPNGWHVPSDAEWTQLTNYVGGQSQYQCNGSSTNIAKALASTTGWSSSTITCAVGNNPSSNNATGFSALPAGYYYAGDYFGFSNDATFWSTTKYTVYSDYQAFCRTLFYDNAIVSRSINTSTKYDGFSLRCVRD